MNPKMSIKEAAEFLNVSSAEIKKKISNESLVLSQGVTATHLGFKESRIIFDFERKKKIISFQIVKGGTGKTSLASSFAVRANMYGYKVLCIDLDQQANLTQTFDVLPKNMPVMIDILAEGHSFLASITQVAPGIDLLASRMENALLDEVIKLKKLQLDQVYRKPFEALLKEYDLIVVDCPPNISQSVAAVSLASDLVVAPVVPDTYALAGLEMIINTIKELEQGFGRKVPFNIVLNKFDEDCKVSTSVLSLLKNHSLYRDYFIESVVRVTQDFTLSAINRESIFSSMEPSYAKYDVDLLTRDILRIDEALYEYQAKQKAALARAKALATNKKKSKLNDETLASSQTKDQVLKEEEIT